MADQYSSEAHHDSEPSQGKSALGIDPRAYGQATGAVWPWASTKGDHGLWIGVMRSIMRAATAASRPSACKAALYR